MKFYESQLREEWCENSSLNNIIDLEGVATGKRKLGAEKNSNIINGVYYWIRTNPSVLEDSKKMKIILENYT